MSAEVYINRTSLFLPGESVDNDDIEAMLGEVAGRRSRSKNIVLRNNGIQARHYVLDPETRRSRYSNARVTAEAVKGFVDSEFSLADIDCLSCGTSSPDQLMPSHGVMVHGELREVGLCEVMAASGICMSGITALKYGWLSVRTGEHRNVVATGSEVASTFMQSKNFEPELQARIKALEARPEIAFDREFLRWMLSDGAGAVLMQDHLAGPGLSLRLDWIESLSFAYRMETCMYAGAEKEPDGTLRGWREFSDLEAAVRSSVFTVKQDVKLLHENITRIAVEEGLSEVRRRRDLEAIDVDWFLPHMSSEYFRQPIAESLERIGFAIPGERWFTNLQTTGNIGSASWYAILDGLVDSGKLSSGERLLCMVPESGRFSVAYLHLTVV
ncbi:beta-ketoacyl-ACP synthase III [Thiohalomonas denitrificans]|uniref:beta-ketoacyl-ACP synthase III n=1 Tax=Thiohalomonas denitrificans TaxID=415747 RepID=UPI0026EE614D|nr:beta-ketoacyl-ACP synthase III [Thiohalomonas denitrificans]